MNTVYLRKEPTKDVLLQNENYKHWHKELKKKTDVVIYMTEEDVKNNKPLARWLWFYKAKPHRNRKTIVINYVKHEIIWLPDKKDTDEKT